MAKYALLVGVGEYEEPTLKPLPGATRDVKEIKKILQDSQFGDFLEANIRLLENPDRYEIEEAIYDLFTDRKKNDLALFYFAGHGITDKLGQFYLATRRTRKDGNKVKDVTAVSARYLQEKMSQSLSEQQVIILDCCFSGAFAKGMTARSDDTVNIQTQLGGKGRAVLASSTSTQYSFEYKDSGFGIYTHYLIEGIQKGEADSDGNGWISVDELHEYISDKVKQYCLEQDITPPMTPEIYAVREGYKIHLVKASTKLVSLKSGRGIDYTILQNLLAAEAWGKADEETTRIFHEITNPDRQDMTHPLSILSIRRFPCLDLQTIDYLWKTFSQGRFGFSAQKRVWESIKGSSNADHKAYQRFLDQVGWGLYYEGHLDRLDSFPEGCLPLAGFYFPWIGSFGYDPNDYLATPMIYANLVTAWLRTRDFDEARHLAAKGVFEKKLEKFWKEYGREHIQAFVERLAICKSG